MPIPKWVASVNRSVTNRITGRFADRLAGFGIVLAAGHCEIETRGQIGQLTAPVVIHDEHQQDVPREVRPILRILGVDEFLRLTTTANDDRASGTP